jgi:hypothetical protein
MPASTRSAALHQPPKAPQVCLLIKPKRQDMAALEKEVGAECTEGEGDEDGEEHYVHLHCCDFDALNKTSASSDFAESFYCFKLSYFIKINISKKNATFGRQLTAARRGAREHAGPLSMPLLRFLRRGSQNELRVLFARQLF